MVRQVAGASAAAQSAGPSAKQRRDEQTRLKEACQEFESIFVGMLLKGMRQTVPKSGLLDGQDGDYFREMLDDEYAKSISKSGRFGLAEALYRQMSKGSPGTDGSD